MLAGCDGAAVSISSRYRPSITNQGLAVGWSFFCHSPASIGPARLAHLSISPSNNSTGEPTNTQIRAPRFWHPHAAQHARLTQAPTNYCALTWRGREAQNNVFAGWNSECRDNTCLWRWRIMGMDIQTLIQTYSFRETNPLPRFKVNTNINTKVSRVSIKRCIPSRHGAKHACMQDGIPTEPEIEARGYFRVSVLQTPGFGSTCSRHKQIKRMYPR